MDKQVKTITMPLPMRSWHAPSYAQIDVEGGPSISVKEMDSATLDGLAARWLEELYTKAGKTNAWEINPNVVR